MEQATFGGGCFWCLEAVFEGLEGVSGVVSGYCGGHVDKPSYQQVCDGRTGHAEVVQISFDANLIDYRTLLEVFFAIHDPTTLNRQGNDLGTQYRSVIFTHSPGQETTARAVIAELSAQGLWGAPVVTQIAPLPVFYPAEAYHQQYFRRNPGQGYCAFVVGPKLAKFRKRYLDRLKPEFR